MTLSRLKCNLGFGGRMFLNKPEWDTYRRRKPGRYIRRPKSAKCQICPQPVTPGNPLQTAHRIGFDVGVIDLGLTPEFLDGETNTITAHRRECNKESELTLEESMKRLRELGVKELPQFLPVEIQEAWRKTAGP
jgi:hypothetical protein